MNNVTLGGTDPRTDHGFAYYETIGGGMGGRNGLPGLSGVHTHMSNTRNTPVEAIEHYLPVRIRRYGLRPDSGGAGAFRRRRRHRARVRDAVRHEVTVLSERRRRQPYGVAGRLARRLRPQHAHPRRRRTQGAGESALQLQCRRPPPHRNPRRRRISAHHDHTLDAALGAGFTADTNHRSSRTGQDAQCVSPSSGRRRPRRLSVQCARIVHVVVRGDAEARRALIAAALGWMLDSFDVMLYALVLASMMLDLGISKSPGGWLRIDCAARRRPPAASLSASSPIASAARAR